MSDLPVKFRKERASRLIRGVIWSVVAVITAPSAADVVDTSGNSTAKVIWAALFTAGASWLTSTVAKRFGDPTDAQFK